MTAHCVPLCPTSPARPGRRRHVSDLPAPRAESTGSESDRRSRTRHFTAYSSHDPCLQTSPEDCAWHVVAPGKHLQGGGAQRRQPCLMLSSHTLSRRWLRTALPAGSRDLRPPSLSHRRLGQSSVCQDDVGEACPWGRSTWRRAQAPGAVRRGVQGRLPRGSQAQRFPRNLGASLARAPQLF